MRRGRSHALALAVSLLLSLGWAGAAHALPGDPCSPDCGPGTTTFTLHITVSAGGSVKQGTLTLCGAGQTCDVDYPEGSSPTLTAEPAAGFAFDHWSGDCSGSTCQPDMTADRSVTATFVDNLPPADATISEPDEDEIVTSASGTTTFSFNDSDPDAVSFRCFVDAVQVFCGEGSNSTQVLTTGPHTIQVFARDSHNNESGGVTRHFKLVRLATATIGGTPAAGTTSGTGTTAFTYGGGDTQRCSLDPANPGTAVYGACPADWAVADGTHTVYVQAGTTFEAATYWNTTATSRTWTVDTHAPSTELTTTPESPTTATTMTFEFSGSDPAPGTALHFDCKLDNSAFEACGSGQSYSGLPPGSHTFSVRAVDAAGNADATPATVTWTVIADADGDGFFTNTDCDDSNAAIHPSASDTPGNGTDEDCSGSDATAATGGATTAPESQSPGTGGAASGQPAGAAVAAKLRRAFKVSRKGALVRSLKLSGVTAGATVTLGCKGKGCAFRSKKVSPTKGAATLQALFKKKTLKPGAVITIKVTHAGMSGLVFTLTVKKKGQPALKTASA